MSGEIYMENATYIEDENARSELGKKKIKNRWSEENNEGVERKRYYNTIRH